MLRIMRANNRSFKPTCVARQKQHRQPAHKQRATCRASYTLAGSEAKRQAFNLSFRALCLIMHKYTSERTHLSHR